MGSDLVQLKCLNAHEGCKFKTVEAPYDKAHVILKTHMTRKHENNATSSPQNNQIDLDRTQEVSVPIRKSIQRNSFVALRNSISGINSFEKKNQDSKRNSFSFFPTRAATRPSSNLVQRENLIALECPESSDGCTFKTPKLPFDQAENILKNHMVEMHPNQVGDLKRDSGPKSKTKKDLLIFTVKL